MITADTNVFIYAADQVQSSKKHVADQVVIRLAALGSPVGLQVVGEFQNVSGRKLGLSKPERARQGRLMLTTFATFLPSRAAAERAIAESTMGQLSYWDALLLASAAEAGCSTILSEDMGDGLSYCGIRVINPFAEDGDLAEAARKALGL